jgi:nucleotide-binding universal stress UspA family protein
LLEGVDFEETVEKYDTTNGVDIIAMITYRRNLCESILQKSTTRNMAFHSKIPILAIPSK